MGQSIRLGYNLRRVRLSRNLIAGQPSGKAGDCKSLTRRFDSDLRVHFEFYTKMKYSEMKDSITRFVEICSEDQILDIYHYIECQYNLCYDKDKEELKILADWDKQVGSSTVEQQPFKLLVASSSLARPTMRVQLSWQSITLPRWLSRVRVSPLAPRGQLSWQSTTSTRQGSLVQVQYCAPFFTPGGVAQSVRALACHARGCEFKSRHSRHFLLDISGFPALRLSLINYSAKSHACQALFVIYLTII